MQQPYLEIGLLVDTTTSCELI